MATGLFGFGLFGAYLFLGLFGLGLVVCASAIALDGVLGAARWVTGAKMRRVNQCLEDMTR